jgi:hypothetical protein
MVLQVAVPSTPVVQVVLTPVEFGPVSSMTKVPVPAVLPELVIAAVSAEKVGVKLKASSSELRPPATMTGTATRRLRCFGL